MGTVIDTSVLIDLERGDSEARLPPGELFVSVMSMAELQVGVEYARTAAQRAAGEAFLHGVLDRFQLVVLDLRIAIEAGRIFHLLAATRRSIGWADTWIAATARALGHELLTGNVADFERVPGLRVVPWLAPSREEERDKR